MMKLLLYVLLTGCVFAASPEACDENQEVSIFTMRALGENVTQEIWDVRGLSHPTWDLSLWRVFLNADFHRDKPYTRGFTRNVGLDNALEQFAVSASHAAGSDDSYLTPPGGWLWWAGPMLTVAHDALKPGRVRIMLWSEDIAIEGMPAQEGRT